MIENAVHNHMNAANMAFMYQFLNPYLAP
jgi:hypothetical protein